MFVASISEVPSLMPVAKTKAKLLRNVLNKLRNQFNTNMRLKECAGVSVSVSGGDTFNLFWFRIGLGSHVGALLSPFFMFATDFRIWKSKCPFSSSKIDFLTWDFKRFAEQERKKFGRARADVPNTIADQVNGLCCECRVLVVGSLSEMR